jgi:hypothetical protein
MREGIQQNNVLARENPATANFVRQNDGPHAAVRQL